MLTIKPKVDISILTPQIVLGIFICERVYQLYTPNACVITSGFEGNHMEGSLHYNGDAVDLRLPVKYYSIADDHQKLVLALQNHLGDGFDVVLEKTHIHIEYDPLMQNHGAKAPT